MRRVIISLLCGGLVLFAYSATAQTPSGPASRRPDPIQGELQRRFEAEAIENVLSRPAQPPTAHEHRDLLAQIRKDFLRIQVVDDELRKERVRNEVDLQAVSKHVSEIKRRSERLKENLSLPKVDIDNTSSPAAETRERLGLRLELLSKSIDAFVTNPIFKSAKIVNTNLSIQASHDVEQIILNSKEIKRLTERLGRL